MQITLIGWLLIPLGLVLALLYPRVLYFITIFSALFSATAVVNIGAGASASGLQVYMYLAALLVARSAFDAVMRMRVRVAQSVRRPLIYLFLFVLVCFTSIAMPFWIDGRLAVMSAVLLETTTSPLHFSSANITGVMYLLLGACSTAVIAQKSLNAATFRSSLKIYTLSGLFTSSWGIFQFACHVLNFPYPAAIFNSSATPSAQGFDSMLGDSGLQRISSVAVEPSLFAASLLTIIPFSLVAIFGEGYVVSQKADRWIFILMFVALLLSTSSTAYVGLVFMTAVALRYVSKYKGLRLRELGVLGIGVLVFIAASVISASVRELFTSALFNKSEGYSALERAKSITYAFGYFRQYPILGIGWSSATSHDTVVKLLSNCGVLGLGAFSMFIIALLAPLWKRLGQITRQDRRMAFDSPALLFLISVMTLIAVMLIDGFPYVFGHFWVTLGLAIAAGVVAKDHPFLFRDQSLGLKHTTAQPCVQRS